METAATLDCLPVGTSAVITGLDLSPAQRRRLLELGFIPGGEVTALQASPWNDPVAYGVCGAVIALRREDARHILIRHPAVPASHL